MGLSDEYFNNMKKGLTMWRDLGSKNLVWGFVVAQKTEKVDMQQVLKEG